jgi:hypothetical protein
MKNLVIGFMCLVAGVFIGWLLRGWSEDSEYQRRRSNLHAQTIELQVAQKEAQDAWQVWYNQKREADPLKRIRVPDVQK